MSTTRLRRLIFAGLTLIFAGYFAVWLPGPAAGLRLIGLEIGEWIKFLGVGRSRDLFYLPPITLALLIVLLTMVWPYGRRQAWLMRLLGFAVSLLSFPSIEAIRFEPPSEWLVRLLLIGLVLATVVLSNIRTFRRRGRFSRPRALWAVIGLIGLIGVVLPTWIYIVVRPTVTQAFGLPLGFGLGIWLNGLGHLLVASVGFIFVAGRAERVDPSPD